MLISAIASYIKWMIRRSTESVNVHTVSHDTFSVLLLLGF